MDNSREKTQSRPKTSSWSGWTLPWWSPADISSTEWAICKGERRIAALYYRTKKTRGPGAPMENLKGSAMCTLGSSSNKVKPATRPRLVVLRNPNLTRPCIVTEVYLGQVHLWTAPAQIDRLLKHYRILGSRARSQHTIGTALPHYPNWHINIWMAFYLFIGRFGDSWVPVLGTSIINGDAFLRLKQESLFNIQFKMLLKESAFFLEEKIKTLG